MKKLFLSVAFVATLAFVSCEKKEKAEAVEVPTTDTIVADTLAIDVEVETDTLAIDVNAEVETDSLQ